MATRVSPRSNASSASSSSSASRIAYRNPSFNRDRDILDPWVSDGRGAYQGKQQHLHRQHNKGQWGHKSNQANRAWGNSDTQIAGKNEERLSWRSQKQAVGNFYMDGGPSNGIQQSYCTYEPSPFPQQGQPAAKTYGNQATPREQSFYSEQRRPAFISEQSPWERHQPNFIKQDHHTSGKIAHSYNPPSSNVNHSQESRGQAIKFHQGFRDDSLNRRQGPGGYSANFNQGSRYTPGNSSRDAGKNSADVTNRGWDAPITRRHEASIDNFPPLTNRVEAGARNVQAVGTSPSATNRFLGGMGASIGSWADECSDDALQTSLQDQVGARGLSIVANSYKADLESPDVSGIRRPNANNSNHRGPVSGVPNNSNHRGPVAGVSNRDTRRQNSRQGSNGALAGEGVQSANRNSWRNQDSIVKQGEASRNTSFPRQHVKHTMSVDPEQRAGAAGDSKRSGASTQNDIYHVGRESREESVRASNDQVFSAQGDAEVPDDVMLPFIMGTCEDMCPLKEREQRERLRDLAVFERVNGNPSKTSKNLAVKKFCRTFSGVKLLSADVRPLRILWSTLQYLLNLLDDSEFSFDVVHNFLFDRTRAIRQELGMQRIANSQAINMYEEIVRFHILSEHELNRRGSGRHVSDSHLNLQQLSKSLLSLFDLYHLNCHEKLANEAEFRAYYVLLNLDSNRHHQADVLSVWFRQCPAVLLNAWELKFARAVLRSYRSGNHRNFFQLAQEATFLQSCLMELHFNEARLKCLAAMNQGGYKLHPIPLADIAKQLLLKEGDLEELCNLCGLSTGMDASRVRCLLVKQSQFSAPKELPSYRCPCIVNKQPSSYYEEVTGTNQRL